MRAETLAARCGGTEPEVPPALMGAACTLRPQPRKRGSLKNPETCRRASAFLPVGSRMVRSGSWDHPHEVMPVGPGRPGESLSLPRSPFTASWGTPEGSRARWLRPTLGRKGTGEGEAEVRRRTPARPQVRTPPGLGVLLGSAAAWVLLGAPAPYLHIWGELSSYACHLFSPLGIGAELLKPGVSVYYYYYYYFLNTPFSAEASMCWGSPPLPRAPAPRIQLKDPASCSGRLSGRLFPRSQPRPESLPLSFPPSGSGPAAHVGGPGGGGLLFFPSLLL